MNTLSLGDLSPFDIAPHLRRIYIPPRIEAICRDCLRQLNDHEGPVLPMGLQNDPAYVQRVLHRMRQTHALPVVRAEQIKLDSRFFSWVQDRHIAYHLTQETRELVIFCKQDVTVPAPPATTSSADDFLLHHITAVREHVDYILHLLAVFDSNTCFQTAYEAWEMAFITQIRRLNACGMSIPDLIHATRAFNDELRHWADKVLELFGCED